MSTIFSATFEARLWSLETIRKNAFKKMSNPNGNEITPVEPSPEQRLLIQLLQQLHLPPAIATAGIPMNTAAAASFNNPITLRPISSNAQWVTIQTFIGFVPPSFMHPTMVARLASPSLMHPSVPHFHIEYAGLVSSSHSFGPRSLPAVCDSFRHATRMYTPFVYPASGMWQNIVNIERNNILSNTALRNHDAIISENTYREERFVSMQQIGRQEHGMTVNLEAVSASLNINAIEDANRSEEQHQPQQDVQVPSFQRRKQRRKKRTYLQKAPFCLDIIPEDEDASHE